MTRKGFVLRRGFGLLGLIALLGGPATGLAQDRIVVSLGVPTDAANDRDDTTPWLLGMGSIDLVVGGAALFVGGLVLEESSSRSGEVVALYVGGAFALSLGIVLGLAALHLAQRVERRPLELDVTPTDRGVELRIRGRF